MVPNTGCDICSKRMPPRGGYRLDAIAQEADWRFCSLDCLLEKLNQLYTLEAKR